MPMFFRLLLSSIAIAAAASLFGLKANAGDPQIEAAIDQGVIGERIDGYLGVVSGTVDPSLLRKVNEINNKRRALYAQLADETGTSTAQVARVTGEKQIEKAGAGAYILDETGSWRQK